MLKQVEELKFSTKISEEKAVSEIVTLNDQKKMLVKEVPGTFPEQNDQ